MNYFGRVLLTLFLCFALIAVNGTQIALAGKVVEFNDNFESYPIGANPTDVYDYWVEPCWVPPPPPQPDRYKVGLIGSNKVLQYQWQGPSIHFPFVSKLYKKQFSETLEAGATFLYTTPSLGWTGILFSWKDPQHYYKVQAMWDNKLYVLSTQSGYIGQLSLWPDKNILAMSHRIEVKRDGNNLIASVTRLDTADKKTVIVTNTDFTDGQVGFGFNEDWWGPVNFTVDNFYARGRIPTLDANIDIQPDTLNLRSKGNYITAYIELPEGYSPSDIKTDTVKLNDNIPAKTTPMNIGDYDSDGTADLMVKFSRKDVEDILEPGSAVNISISGDLSSDMPFEGVDTIKVLSK